MNTVGAPSQSGVAGGMKVEARPRAKAWKYTGPADGMSHTPHQHLLRAVNSLVVPLVYRERLQGKEKLPLTGPQVYCYDHPSLLEPVLMTKEIKRDVRSIAVDALFVGPFGPLFTLGGGYPVHRDHPSQITVRHSIDILKQGLGLSIAGAAGTSPDPLVVPPFHTGPAGFAIDGGAENITPVTFYYHKDTEERPVEKALGYAAAAIATLAGATAVALASPALAVAAATTGAVLGGAWLAGHLADRYEPKSFVSRAFTKLGINVGAGAAGGTAAGVTTALALAAAPAAAPVLLVAGVMAGGLGVLGLAHAWRTRDVAEMVIGDPIPVQPYVDQYTHHEAIHQLTEDVHRSISETKAKLTGIPYDENAPRIARFQHTNDPHPSHSPVGPEPEP